MPIETNVSLQSYVSLTMTSPIPTQGSEQTRRVEVAGAGLCRHSGPGEGGTFDTASADSWSDKAIEEATADPCRGGEDVNDE